jgi:hypothetical protein
LRLAEHTPLMSRNSDQHQLNRDRNKQRATAANRSFAQYYNLKVMCKG